MQHQHNHRTAHQTALFVYEMIGASITRRSCATIDVKMFGNFWWSAQCLVIPDIGSSEWANDFGHSLGTENRATDESRYHSGERWQQWGPTSGFKPNISEKSETSNILTIFFQFLLQDHQLTSNSHCLAQLPGLLFALSVYLDHVSCGLFGFYRFYQLDFSFLLWCSKHHDSDLITKNDALCCVHFHVGNDDDPLMWQNPEKYPDVWRVKLFEKENQTDNKQMWGICCC